MGVVQNVIGIVRDLHQHQQTAQIDNALKNYMTDPEGTIKAINQIDAPSAIALQQQHTATVNAAQDRMQKISAAHLAAFTAPLRALPRDGSVDFGKAIDDATPYLTTNVGMTPDEISRFKTMVVNNPHIIDGLDDETAKAVAAARAKDEFSNTVAAPGDHVIRQGKVIDRVPYAIKAVTTPAGGATTPFDPNSGAFVTGGGSADAGVRASSPTDQPVSNLADAGHAPVPMTVAGLRPFLLAQETGGEARPYAAVNKTTGALGRYQVMPETGKALAQRLGLPWRPDMMRHDDPASKRYQDAIGGRAIQDSIDAGQGNLAAVFSHYYSGSPTAYQNPQGNPKTAKYVQDLLGRMGVGGSANLGGGGEGGPPVVTATGVYVPPRPQRPRAGDEPVKTLTPQEVIDAGFPAGAIVQQKQNGEYKVVDKPAKGKAGATADPAEAIGTARSAIAELRNNLKELRDDPKLSSGTGVFGTVMSYVHGSHRQYLEGLTKQIDAQKLVSLLTELKAAGGNPLGNRILKSEVDLLPKTLGNFNLNQNPADLRRNVDKALAQLDSIDARLNASAARQGVGTAPRAAAPAAPAARRPTAINPRTGARVEWNGQGWVPMRGN